jgi:superfamily II RNA helicase
MVCWTEWGQLASHFAEVESLIFTPLVKDLQGLTPQQLVGFLSCFTKITKSKTMATKTDSTIQTLVQKTKDIMSEMETDGIYFEKDNFTTDLVGTVMEWCDLTDEQSCKYFIQQKVADISVGDFTKVILKIVAIVHEIEKASADNIELLYTCSQVEPLLLKYIATIKSLYV